MEKGPRSQVSFERLEKTRVELTTPGLQHYENTPMQYKVIFTAVKNNNFQMKIFDIFLIFAVNLDRGYTLEPPQ